jgi:hypothetical protein
MQPRNRPAVIYQVWKSGDPLKEVLESLWYATYFADNCDYVK